MYSSLSVCVLVFWNVSRTNFSCSSMCLWTMGTTQTVSLSPSPSIWRYPVPGICQWCLIPIHLGVGSDPHGLSFIQQQFTIICNTYNINNNYKYFLQIIVHIIWCIIRWIHNLVIQWIFTCEENLNLTSGPSWRRD